MNEEIRRAIEEQNANDAAIQIIRSRHHHDDGTVPEISPVGSSPIELRIVEEESAWRQSQIQQGNFEVFKNEEAKQQILPNQEEAVQKRQKAVMMGCNCGKSFEAVSDSSGTRITSFDRQGNVSGTYSVSKKGYGAVGKNEEQYGASGQTSEGYGTQGTAPKNYGS